MARPDASSDGGDAPFMLDASGYYCPIPVLKTQKALSNLPDKALLLVTASDPAALIDMAHFCQTAGHGLLSTEQKDGVLRFLIRKGNPG